MRYALYYWDKKCEKWVRKDFDNGPFTFYTITKGTIIDQYAFKEFDYHLPFDLKVIQVTIHGKQAAAKVSFHCVKFKRRKNYDRNKIPKI